MKTSAKILTLTMCIMHTVTFGFVPPPDYCPSGATDHFGYVGLGNLCPHTNVEGRVYTMTYNALSRPLTATNAANEQLFLNSHDLAGNLTNRLDNAGNSITYSYDVLNRLTERAAQSVQSVQSVDKFSYDPVGNLLTASNETARLAFTYDVMDRLTTASTKLTTNYQPLTTYQSAYAYDVGISIAATLGASAANATTAPSISISDDFITVSRWGREGLPPGDFVMKGKESL